MKRYIVGITGASGSIYGLRLVEELLKKGAEVHLIVTKAGSKVMPFETDIVPDKLLELNKSCEGNLVLHDIEDLFASVASGSFKTEGMVIVPCSMSTLGEVAWGSSKNLLGRAADVCIKERRKLIVVPRETPLSPIHLRNMLTLCEAGAVILPAMPGFYHKPKDIAALVDSIVGRIMDTLGIENELYNRWGEDYEKNN